LEELKEWVLHASLIVVKNGGFVVLESEKREKERKEEGVLNEEVIKHQICTPNLMRWQPSNFTN